MVPDKHLLAHVYIRNSVFTIYTVHGKFRVSGTPVYLTYYYDSSTFNCDHYFVRQRPVHDVQYVLNDDDFTTCISLFQGGESTFLAWERIRERRQFDTFLIGANLRCSPIEMDVFTETSAGNIVHCKMIPSFIPRNGLSTCRYRCSCLSMCSNVVSLSVTSRGLNKPDWTLCEWMSV